MTAPSLGPLAARRRHPRYPRWRTWTWTNGHVAGRQIYVWLPRTTIHMQITRRNGR